VFEVGLLPGTGDPRVSQLAADDVMLRIGLPSKRMPPAAGGGGSPEAASIG